MITDQLRRSRPQVLWPLATTGILLTLASAGLAGPTVDGMRVADPTAGAWGCYEVTMAGDLVLYPYPQPAAWTALAAGSAQDEGHSILGWRGYYEIRPGGLVALQPFSDLSMAGVHEEACIGATVH